MAHADKAGRDGFPRRLIVVLALFGGLVAGCSGMTTSQQPPATGATQSSVAAAASSPGAASTVLADLPVVSCPTTFGITPPPTPVALPSSEQVTVPAATASELAVYADDQDTMQIVGPKSWDCTASYGADGSGGVVVYPPGLTVPTNWGAGWKLTVGSTVTAIAGTETSACYTCGLAQACALFTSAASSYNSYLGHACTARPGSEIVAPIGSGLVSFQDPPGVSGDGLPSGGQYPANGVMTYYPNAGDGSWLETCTLPASEKAECTAALNAFIARYGTR